MRPSGNRHRLAVGPYPVPAMTLLEQDLPDDKNEWPAAWMASFTDTMNDCCLCESRNCKKKIVAFVTAAFSCDYFCTLFLAGLIPSLTYPRSPYRCLLAHYAFLCLLPFLSWECRDFEFSVILVLTSGSVSRWVRGRGHSWSPVHGWRCIYKKKHIRTNQ